jgi:predicted aminopeptidase
MKDRFFAILLTIVLTWLALMITPACSSVAYYGQAISGHLSLMRRREPIDKLLAGGQTEAELAEHLKQAQAILDFAETQLELDADGSYRKVVISGQSAVSWNVIVAGEFSVDAKLWCFPVAGCVPYRGYFKQERAQQVAERSRSEGFDVYVSPAAAYSTLGWFDDPLIDTMFQYSETQLAAVLIHELAHKKLYVADDTEFSESFAEFVESIGVQRWLQHTGNAQALQSWSRRRLAQPRFDALLASTRESLRQIYHSAESQEHMRKLKQETLDQMRSDYLELVEQQWQGNDYFGAWIQGELNNAKLSLAESYAGGACAFAALFEEAGENLAVFYALATQKSTENEAHRKSWLQQPCTAFASVPDL